jgi:hypothetical protein
MPGIYDDPKSPSQPYNPIPPRTPGEPGTVVYNPTTGEWEQAGGGGFPFPTGGSSGSSAGSGGTPWWKAIFSPGNIFKGIGTGLNLWGAISGSRAANDAADIQKQLYQQQAAMARQLAGLGQSQIATSQPALNKALAYYTNLAAGNRASINSTLAPDRAQLAETYKGAQRGVEARTAQGPQRDRAIAELMRQQAGQSGLMPFMARGQANEQLAGLGNRGLDRAVTAFAGASGGLKEAGSAANMMAANQQNASNAWRDFGKSIWDLWGPQIMGGR